MDSGGWLVRVIANYELGLFAMVLILSFCWLFELFLVIAVFVLLTGSISDSEKSTLLGILSAGIVVWTILTIGLTAAVWRAWQVAVPNTPKA
ncbi:MAG: hypothetical protein E6K03_07315 [Methanobacteriota archaeon]|nr:MAG: hypothetical protein E6K03_07315 [Euryarchaeota archaeon]